MLYSSITSGVFPMDLFGVFYVSNGASFRESSPFFKLASFNVSTVFPLDLFAAFYVSWRHVPGIVSLLKNGVVAVVWVLVDGGFDWRAITGPMESAFRTRKFTWRPILLAERLYTVNWDTLVADNRGMGSCSGYGAIMLNLYIIFLSLGHKSSRTQWKPFTFAGFFHHWSF